MAISGAEILLYASAIRLFANQLEAKNPSIARPYAHSLMYTLRGSSQPPQIRTQPHNNYRSPLSFSVPERKWVQSHWRGFEGLFLGLETLGQRIRKDSCWQLKILCLDLKIKWPNVGFHGTPTNRWLQNSGKAHSSTPQPTSCSLGTRIFQAWKSEVSGGSKTNPGSSKKWRSDGWKETLKTLWGVSSMTWLLLPSLTLASYIIFFLSPTTALIN